MTKCFLITHSSEEEIVALDPDNVIAFKIIEEVVLNKELPFELEAKMSKGGKWLEIENDVAYELPDLLGSSLAWNLFSVKAKELIQNALTGQEDIEWIPVTVKVPKHSTNHQYFLVTFTRELDVLNYAKTTFVSGTDLIIKPHFDIEKISKYALFTAPASYNFWKIPSGLYVIDSIKVKIETSTLRGFDFKKASCS
jgi:hypothetical protein